jgi:lycopene cyclase domain-containing protein
LKEYTLLAAVSVIVTFFLDRRMGTRIIPRLRFLGFIALLFALKLWVNGYLTCADIVRYNPRFYLGLRIGCIPVEDFLFGFSMIAQTVIFWEYFKRRGSQI